VTADGGLGHIGRAARCDGCLFSSCQTRAARHTQLVLGPFGGAQTFTVVSGPERQVRLEPLHPRPNVELEGPGAAVLGVEARVLGGDRIG